MNKTVSKSITILLLTVLFSAVAFTLSFAAATVVLDEDFEDGVGPEWSSNITYTTPSMS